jgi:hypothetical protein
MVNILMISITLRYISSQSINVDSTNTMSSFCKCNDPNCRVKNMTESELLALMGMSGAFAHSERAPTAPATPDADSAGGMSMEGLMLMSLLSGTSGGAIGAGDLLSLLCGGGGAGDASGLLSLLMGGIGNSRRSDESIEDFVKRKDASENEAGFFLVERRESAKGLTLIYVKETAYDANSDLDELDDSDVRKITIADSMGEAAKTLKFYSPGTSTATSTGNCPCGRPDCSGGASARATRAAGTTESEKSEYIVIRDEVNKIIKPSFPEVMGEFSEYIARVDRDLREPTELKPALTPVMRGSSKNGGIAVHYVKKEICDRPDLTEFTLMLSDTWTLTAPLSKDAELKSIELYDFPNNACESKDKLDITVKTVPTDETAETDANKTASTFTDFLSSLLGVPLSEPKDDAETEAELKTEVEAEPKAVPETKADVEASTETDDEMPPLVSDSDSESDSDGENRE